MAMTGATFTLTRRALWQLLPAFCVAKAHPTLAQTGPPKPKPPFGRDPGGVAVAIIGAGVDFRRPEIAARIARDGEGELIAWDVIDDDARPLEAAPAPGRRVPAFSGTAMAELFLTLAKPARLIPIRVPDANPMALGGALAFASQTPARIAVVLTASTSDHADRSWTLFAEVAQRSWQLLLIAPAGHSGGNLDLNPMAPASLGLGNLLVATAADAAGALHAGVTWGATRVDVAVTVTRVTSPAAGSTDSAAALENAAAVTLAAIAAGVAASEPGLDGAGLKARILALAKPLPEPSERRTRTGWIASEV